MKNQSIAIIGTGFSGLMCAYEIVEQATHTCDLFLFDPHLCQGFGIAYSTDCPLHLLNVPAGKMGAISGSPCHFFEWLEKEPHKWRTLDPSFNALTMTPETFVPRMIYERYLRDIKNEIEKKALEKQIHLAWISEKVEDIEKYETGFCLKTSSKRLFHVDTYVLAISTSWGRRMTTEPIDNYFENPWPTFTKMAEAQSFLKKLPPKSSIGIIGSGLTMIDTVATLHACGFQGKINIISNRGLLPQKHVLHPSPSDFTLKIDEMPLSARLLMRKIRLLCRQHEWRRVIDALRCFTPLLWKRLPIEEQRLFLRKLLGWWNIHRHRVPHQMIQLINQLKEEGRLVITSAHVEKIAEEKQKPKLILKGKKTVSYDAVINCSGSSHVLNLHPSLLIQNLLKKGWIQPDRHGLGIQTTNTCPYVIGALLFGTLFETTAVPEIRNQCKEAAQNILALTP